MSKFPVNELLKMLKTSLKEAKERDTTILGSYDGQYDKLENSLNWIKEEKKYLKDNKDLSKDYRNYMNRMIREEIRDAADLYGKQVGVIKLGNSVYWKDKLPVSPTRLSMLKSNEEDLELFDDIVANAGGFETFKRKYPTILADIAYEYGVNVEQYLEWRDIRHKEHFELYERAKLQQAQEKTKIARQENRINKSLKSIDEIIGKKK